MKSYDTPEFGNSIFFHIRKHIAAGSLRVTTSIFFLPAIKLESEERKGQPKGAADAAKFRFP